MTYHNYIPVNDFIQNVDIFCITDFEILHIISFFKYCSHIKV